MNIKRYIKGASVFIAVTLMLYIAGAFINASFNIHLWNEGSRVLILIIWLILSPIISL